MNSQQPETDSSSILTSAARDHLSSAPLKEKPALHVPARTIEWMYSELQLPVAFPAAAFESATKHNNTRQHFTYSAQED